MSSTRSLPALDQLLRRGRIQARRTARRVASYSTQRRKISTTLQFSGRAEGPKRKTFFEWYSTQLDVNPLRTKIITSGLIAATGDVLCQAVVPADEDEGSKLNDDKSVISISSFSWDYLRTARFAAVGAFWMAPAVHVWYGALTTRFLPGAATPLRTAQRVFLDQFAFGPFFTSSLLSIVWLLEGRWQEDASKTLNTLGENLPDIVVTGWKVWIPAMSINFGFVPLKYQVLYNNVLSLFWNAYLSYVSANSERASIADGTAVESEANRKLASRFTSRSTTEAISL